MRRKWRKPSPAMVVACLALFVALAPAAYATHEVILSSDIVDGEVKNPDLANNAVNSAKVANGTLSGNDIADNNVFSADVRDDTSVNGGLAAIDLQANSVTQSEIATDGVAALEIQDNSIDTGEIVDFSLSNQDVGVLFAEVNADGTLANSSGGGVTTARVGAVGAGTYEVDFARNVTACSAVATIGPAGGGSANGDVNVADRAGNVEAVFVDTNDGGGAAADRPFRLVVVC